MKKDYLKRLEILVDQAVTKKWSMDKLAGLLSKPKRMDDYATADVITKPKPEMELGTPTFQKRIPLSGSNNLLWRGIHGQRKNKCPRNNK